MKPAIVLFTLFLICHSAKLPSSFIKCKRNTPEFKECSVRAGIDALSKMNIAYPEVNIPSLEPFVVPEANIDTNSDRVKTTQHLKNTKYSGFTKVEARKFDWDFDKKTLTLEGVFPEIRVEGEYELEGRILLLDLKGKGMRRVNLKNIDVAVTLKYEETKRKGKTYLKFVSGDIKLKPGFMHLEFENLFNDKALSDNINKSLNENWEAVWEGIEGDYAGIILKIFINLGNGLFSKVSMEEAFD